MKRWVRLFIFLSILTGYFQFNQPSLVFADESSNIESNAPNNQQTSVKLDAILPYAQFIEYRYTGDQMNYPSSNIILEFSADSQGRFQVVRITSNSVHAVVYQLKQQGLYELADFSDYTDVRDLRYDDSVEASRGSLILPAQLSVGTQYQSGYQDEIQMTVVEIIPALTMNQVIYEDVVKIHEEGSAGEFYHYYAPIYGLIAVEQIDGGETTTVLQQVYADGYLDDID